MKNLNKYILPIIFVWLIGLTAFQIFKRQHIAYVETNNILQEYKGTAKTNAELDLMFKNGDTSNSAFIDDFRIHPIYTGIASYVYNQNTENLNYILGSNGMATHFKYDAAGRLVETWQEVADFKNEDNSITEGGFKLMSIHKNNYSN